MANEVLEPKLNRRRFLAYACGTGACGALIACGVETGEPVASTNGPLTRGGLPWKPVLRRPVPLEFEMPTDKRRTAVGQRRLAIENASREASLLVPAHRDASYLEADSARDFAQSLSAHRL